MPYLVSRVNIVPLEFRHKKGKGREDRLEEGRTRSKEAFSYKEGTSINL
jgi:hypothetical protein